MSYQKFVVDNVTCSRRFHVAYDDRDPNQSDVRLDCPYCGVQIFSAKNHPAVELIRQENLVRTAELSDQITTECHLRDTFSEKRSKK